MRDSSRVNGVILSSIPIQRKLKRYWVSKYERIAANCGTSEAVRKVKNLRIALLSYLADEDRIANRDSYLKSAGFRVNGYLRMLFEYADTQPEYVLNFLKMYTSPTSKPTKSVKRAAKDTFERLRAIKAQSAVPQFLIEWLRLLIAFGMNETYARRIQFYWAARRDASNPFHRYASDHSPKEWHAYWSKWYRLLRRGWQSDSSPDFKPVFPEIYVDSEEKEGMLHSTSYEEDVANLIAMHWARGPLWFADPVLSDSDLDFIDSFLDEKFAEDLLLIRDNPGNSALHEDFVPYVTNLSGQYVGHVQHIPKKGSGDDYRDIAVPNRFIQNALVPAANVLYEVVKQLPRDATYNQDRFDTFLTNRVQNASLYQGSVDLSKATDNLPLSWGETIVMMLDQAFSSGTDIIMMLGLEPTITEKGKRVHALKPQSEEFYKSFGLFSTIARSNWEDEGYLCKWEVGQPLGSLPSFAMLALTHNLLLESMAFSLGLGHSPYVVLGDDVVITNKKLRKRYIRELTSRSIPLSLHKSFSGRLSEFAGKVYVRGCSPFHCPDHSVITWNSLLDFQRASGIRIPWENLPQGIKSRATRLVREYLDEKGHPSSFGKEVLLAHSAYSLVLYVEVMARGSHVYPMDNAELNDLIERYYYELWGEETIVPDPFKHTGITQLGSGHPVTLMSTRFADHDGYFHRFRPVALPEWYKAKYRPCATDAAMRAAIAACLTADQKTS